MGVLVTDVAALPAMMMGGPPVAVVCGLKDRPKAVEAVDKLVRLLEIPEREGIEEGSGDVVRPESGPDGAAKPREYRKVSIRYLGEMGRLAIMEDRVVLGLSDNAVKSVIDTALDRMGGFNERDGSQRLAAMCGDGPAVFKMDLAAFAGMFWPFLMQLAEQEPASFPLASLPSAAKMVRLLGPEIAVFQPDADGLLMNSRGKVPFATKFSMAWPLGGYFLFSLHM